MATLGCARGGGGIPTGCRRWDRPWPARTYIIRTSAMKAQGSDLDDHPIARRRLALERCLCKTGSAVNIGGLKKGEHVVRIRAHRRLNRGVSSKSELRAPIFGRISRWSCLGPAMNAPDRRHPIKSSLRTSPTLETASPSFVADAAGRFPWGAFSRLSAPPTGFPQGYFSARAREHGFCNSWSTLYNRCGRFRRFSETTHAPHLGPVRVCEVSAWGACRRHGKWLVPPAARLTETPSSKSAAWGQSVLFAFRPNLGVSGVGSSGRRPKTTTSVVLSSPSWM